MTDVTSPKLTQHRGPGRPPKVSPVVSPPVDHPTETEPLLSVREVATLLGVRKSMIYQLCHSHRLPALRIGKYFRFRREEVLRWLETMRYCND